MSIKEKQQELIDTFNLFSDWEQKYEYIIELGKELLPMPEDRKNENHLIKGCQSQVWLDAELQEYLATKELNFKATLDPVEAFNSADYVIISTPTNYDPQKNFFDTSSVPISDVAKLLT